MTNLIQLPGTASTRNVLSDVLDEYIESDVDVCYQDLLCELETKIKYHSDCLERASDLYNTLLKNSDSVTV